MLSILFCNSTLTPPLNCIFAKWFQQFFFFTDYELNEAYLEEGD